MALAAAHSEVELTKHACRSYQDQLKGAEEALNEYKAEAQKQLNGLEIERQNYFLVLTCPSCQPVQMRI